MADLPKESFSNDPCFHPFWARYVWTFFIKGEELRIKHYGKMASRSVHIEIMYSLDANSFIHSFRYLGISLLIAETFKLCVLTKEVSLLVQNTAIRGLLLKCVTCQILHVIVGKQKMADLQKKVSLMIHLSPILRWICLDPFLVKERRLELNHYGTMASRAVHIEITYSLDANSFIHPGI